MKQEYFIVLKNNKDSNDINSETNYKKKLV